MWIFFFVLLFLCLFQNGKAQDVNEAATPAYAAMQQLTEFRRQHRKTTDGRLCAAAFVQDGITYTDCTDARAPDGNTGREWCFVEVQEIGKGSRDWEFCSPAINYDKIRAKAREAFEMKSAEVEKMVERLDGEVQRLEDMKHRYNTTCGIMHEGTGERVAKMETLLSRGQHCLAKIQETTSKIGVLKSAIEQIHDDMSKAEKKLLGQREFCGFVPGYEDDPFADGMRGTYFSNPFLEGAPRAFRDDKAIDFVFSGKGPIDGISAHKYSIRWDGYVLAPTTGSFTFITETSSGARLFLSGRAIIVDRMPAPSSSEEDAEEIPVPIIPATKKSGVQKVESTPQQLLGGKKYKIRLEMIHSAHLKYNNPDTAIIKLLWKSGVLEEQVIPRKFLFKSNPSSPIKISGLDPQNFETSILYNGERAFKDSVSFVVADVPQRFEGRRMIRTNSSPSMDSFKMSINSPSVVYVASLLNEPLPLAPCGDNPWKARDSLNVLSVYRHYVPLSHAVASTVYKIWFIELREGGDIEFEVIQKSSSFFLFVEQKKESESTCGGEEEVLSITDGPYFEGCETSSKASDDYGCRAGLNGKHMDQRNGIWRTASGNGVGEYIAVRFKKDVQITQFRFKPRDDAIYSPSEITLIFSEGGSDDEQAFSIMHVNNLMHNTYDLPKPVITNYVKAEITQMNMNGEESGGSIEFIGTPCNTPEQSINRIAQYQEIKIPRCDMTVKNIPEILPLEDGQQFIASCPRDCVRAPEGVVHGVDVYSSDSTICLASVHAGVCGNLESSCRVLVMVGGRKDYFDGESQNGVTSYSRGADDASLTFAKAPPAQCSDEAEKIKYYISFQSSADAALPEGYLVDNGQVKVKRSEVFYGWLRPAKPQRCFVSPIANVLNSGGVSFPPASASAECMSGANCEANFWSISVPENGNYEVEVQVGSPCQPTKGKLVYYLQINGFPAISGMQLEKGQFYWATEKVDVSDNKIILTSVCEPSAAKEGLCDHAITTLMNIKIRKLSNPPESVEKSLVQ